MQQMSPPILVLFDGHCGLCRRTMRALRTLDWLGKLRYVNFHDDEQRSRFAPEISFKDLNRALHIKFPSGKTLEGFSALRALSWSLLPLWPIAPFLYIPGVKFFGDRVYARVAAARQRCAHENCNL